MTREEYLRFSAPFDRQILEAARGARLNIMHLHGDTVYLDLFWKGWPATGISYDCFGTGVSIAAARKQYAGVLMAGLNHTTTRTDPPATLKAAIAAARPAAPKWILAPGCSVPDESTDAELQKLTKACAG
jgi:uroporphyrinogen-III decarboxylase